MSDGHRLAQLIREAGKTPQNEVVDIVMGEVTSVNPLKVKVESRELTQSFLIVGALCKETRINSSAFNMPSHQHTTSNGPTGATKTVPTDVLLWRGLMVGDKVLMLKVGRGQKYYIIQREDGI